MLTQIKQVSRVLIVYRKPASTASHIGLGVSSLQNVNALRKSGYLAEARGVETVRDIEKYLASDQGLSALAHHVPITHVVIAALWIATPDVQTLVTTFPQIDFAIVSHSNVGFLQFDPLAIKLLREDAQIATGVHNLQVAANSGKLQSWWTATYQNPMIILPNMYPFTSVRHKPIWNGGLLRIGCFGALRPQKNILTAAAAALEMGVRLRAQQLEFWISGGRVENGGNPIFQAIVQMYQGVPRVKMVQNTWQSWPAFLDSVGAMDLLMQPSYTESFNMVTADGIARGVASVIGDSIDWAPSNWVASTDSAVDIANKGIALLHDPSAVEEGVTALTKHNRAALASWEQFLALQ